MPLYEFIGYECVGGIATATLRRPEKLNAFHEGMLRELGQVLAEAAGRDEVRLGLSRLYLGFSGRCIPGLLAPNRQDASSPTVQK